MEDGMILAIVLAIIVGSIFVNVNAALIVLIIGIVITEWNYERKKSGKREATEKMLFGALMFMFFYGIVIEAWLLSVVAAGVIGVLFSAKREVGTAVAVCTLLVIGFSYLAFAYSYWFFVPVFATIVFQWVWTSRIVKATELENK